MAFSLAPSCGVGRLNPRIKARLPPRASAQSNANEGKSSIGIIDAKMGVLKERMQVVRMREKLQRRSKAGEGWCYLSGYDCYQMKRENKLADYLEIAELVAGNLGITITGCTLCLCLVSLVAHLG